METIWKFELDLSNGNVSQIEMPADAATISAGVQGETFVVWALVDPDAPRVTRRFVIHGTGHPVLKEVTETFTAGIQDHPVEVLASFINTVFMGPMVFHVFDLGEVVQ